MLPLGGLGVGHGHLAAPDAHAAGGAEDVVPAVQPGQQEGKLPADRLGGGLRKDPGIDPQDSIFNRRKRGKSLEHPGHYFYKQGGRGDAGAH